jgi:hypothetical protein
VSYRVTGCILIVSTCTEKYNIKTDIDCGSEFRAFMWNFINEFVMIFCTRRNFSETGFPSNLSPGEVQICSVQLFFWVYIVT